MKDKKIILDTSSMLGFRLADTKQSLGVASGVKLSVKVGGKGKQPRQPSIKVGAMVGAMVGEKGWRKTTRLTVYSNSKVNSFTI